MKCKCGGSLTEVRYQNTLSHENRYWKCESCGNHATSWSAARQTNPLLRHSANAEHLKAFIRSPYAFPGAYALIAVMDDGECLCHDCTKDNYLEILHATKTADRCGWNFIDVMINYEDPSLYCAHCDEPLQPEYCAHEQSEAA